jgi:hypothetical protein
MYIESNDTAEIKSGKHLLAASISPFDPTATLAAPSGRALNAGFHPYQAK